VTVHLVPDSLEHSRRVTGAPLNDSTPSAEPMRQEMIVLATPQRSTTLQMGGKGYVYGISLETATGVQVDNIPMRGAAGTNFTAMSRTHFASYFRNTHTALVIMQFGGNAMPSIRSRAAVEKYVESMRQQIRYLMSAAGEASLLFIGPSDMITTVEGEQMSYPMLPYLDQALAAMVTEQGGAYYSLFRLMGGAGSMFSWRDKGLAGEDMIHFTRAGAKKVGEMLAKQLLEDYDNIVERSGAPDSAKMIAEPQDTVTPTQMNK
jgi:lysophospholipase L1-like esterase